MLGQAYRVKYIMLESPYMHIAMILLYVYAMIRLWKDGYNCKLN